MNFLRSFPTGWFWDNHLWWGKALDGETVISRGAMIDQLPDLRTADRRALLNLRSQNLHLLSSIGESNALQIHWSVEDDYYADLKRYDMATEAADADGRLTRWCRGRRRTRSAFYRDRLGRGELRRERVYFYLAQRCTDLRGAELKSLTGCERYLRSVSASVEAKMRQMELNYSIGRWTPLTDEGHAAHLRRFLNPSLATALASGEVGATLDPERSIRANCLRSDVMPFTFGSGENSGVGLTYDGMYHAIFVVTRMPMQTRPGMLLPLFNANQRNCTVTQNIYPLPVEPEIEKLRGEIDELSKFLNDPKSTGVDREILNKRGRIDSLLASVVMPFKVLTVVRVWGETVEELSGVALAAKTALGRLNGLNYHMVNDPVRARHLFLETLPGNLGSSYRDWDMYCENLNLADLMPVNSTFTGHLDEAEVLLDSPGGGLAGVRFFAKGVPQSTTVIGVTGAGKTSLMVELLSQIEHQLGYMYLQEEGMALATYAQVRGIPSIPLKESSEFTLNPFDTFGLPLTSGNQATVCKTAMKLVGLSGDQDKNKSRENLIGQYAALLYRDLAEDYRDRDEGRWHQLTKRTMVADRLRRGDDDILDGFSALRALEKKDAGRYEEMMASLREEEVIRFQTNPQAREMIGAMVFTMLRPEDYPQWRTLGQMMKSGRMSHHRAGAVSDELNRLVDDLAQGNRFGGRVGGLIDGPSNVPLFGAGIHLDTSYLSDGPTKELAGFLFPEMARKHIMALPRSVPKLMFLDELRRLLMIPDAPKYVMEMLAQLRKYRACFVGAFQTPSQIDDINPALAAVLMGQCKQHFLMRQNETTEIQKIADAIQLPEVAQRAIFSHPLIEHQSGPVKATYFTLFSNEGNGTATCGTVRVQVDPYTLYVASSNGEVFDRKAAALRNYKDTTEGVYAEVDAEAKRGGKTAAA